MPKLSEIGNADAVDSVYAARAIVYVEAEADSKVFARIVGMSGAQQVAFKEPRVDGGGFHAVCMQVRQERENGNGRVFGLIDGEAAVTRGNLCDLISATSAIFPLSDQDGIFCLADHELENLMLLYGDVCGYLVNDVPLGKLATRSRAEVERTLRGLTLRFFMAAVLKYAALHLRHGGRLYRPVDVGRFQQKDSSTKSIREALKRDIIDSGLDWNIFRDQAMAIIFSLRRRFRDERMSKDARSFHMLRLSDGKGLMKRLISEYNATTRMEGHLVDRLVRSNYSGVFRSAILTLISV